MEKLRSKDQVISELEKAGIKICLTRCVGHNGARLVYESYGVFVVNAEIDSDINKIMALRRKFSNILIYQQ